MPRVVVIGSNGQLAADLLRVFGAAAVGLTRQQLDVTDEHGTQAQIASLRPDWLINTAAFHRVDDCEIESARAFQVNALGALHAARAAAMVGAGIVFFSTDYVFGGNKQRTHPYAEDDPPAPVNVYGASKVAGEQLVRLANPRHLIIRTAGLYGAAGSRKGWTFPGAILEQARSGSELRVVSDQVVSPTYATDLATTVKQLIEREATGLFHVANAGACSWFEFAQAICAGAGIGVNLDPITSEQSGRRARRPAYSVLQSKRMGEFELPLLRPWQDALREYLALVGASGESHAIST